MSYKVLYRKYRPSIFEEIVGQKSIVDSLKKSVESSSFSHAYIFTGPRGTGKTSTAKVLAKVMNCTNPTNGEACGACENCKNFSTSPDIIEIDAASNNGVDEIRELRNNISLAPAASKYKVYIIDEVHMLSPGAFNALLKTLEEPPAHAIFILATTEVYKVPITILSRCQRFDFKKIQKAEMLDHLKEICKKEKIDFESDALEEIYSLSEGCLRDALSILDQTAKLGTKISLDTILTNYNVISNETVKKLLDFVINGDTLSIIEEIEDMENSGMNPQKLIKRIIGCLEKMAIETKISKKGTYGFDIIDKLIHSLNAVYIDARINENTYTMIKLCFLEQISDPKETLGKKESKKITAKEEDSTIVEQKPTEIEKIHSDISIKEIRVNNCFVEVNKASLNDIIEIWNNLDAKKLSAIDIKNYKPVASSNNYTIFTTEENSLAQLFNMKSDEIEKCLKKQKKGLKVVALTSEEWNIEREKYKDKLKKKDSYKYIEEPEKTDDSTKIKEELGSLFADELVEIS